MNAEFRLGHKLNDPIKSVRGIVRVFWREPWDKADINNTERECLQHWGKIFIERAVDENRAFECGGLVHPFGG